MFSPGIVFGRCLPTGSVVPSEDSTSSEWPTLGDAWRWVSARLPKQIDDLIRWIYVATRPDVEQLGEPVSTNYAEGAERLTFERMTVIALDPDKLDIRPVYYKEYSNSGGVDIQIILADPNVVAAINGDFFDNEGEPLGPTIINGKEVYPGTPMSKDNIIGGFLVETSGKISIVRNTNLKDLKAKYKIKQFFGSGTTRTILFNGQIDEESITKHPYNEPNYIRSAVCVTKDDKVLFVASLGTDKDYESINSHKMAEILKELHCVDAIELDGGFSSIGMGDFYVGSSSRPSYIAAFRK
jgi:uncharacterized protein YigE (DUF2233 family)